MVAVGMVGLWISYALMLYGWVKLHNMPNINIWNLILPGKLTACGWHDAVVQGKATTATPCSAASNPSSDMTSPPMNLMSISSNPALTTASAGPASPKFNLPVVQV